MLLLHNTVQRYKWGTVDGLVALVGSEPSGGPEAELWVGTHPLAPSVVVDDPQARTLAEVVAGDPARWLGPELAAQGMTALPFLLKILAIGAPLSLQAHPSAAQAEVGFAREEASGPARDAPNRTYRDANPKPEALVALRDTWALCGFREPTAAAELVAGLGLAELEPLVAVLRAPGGHPLRDALAWLLGLAGPTRLAVAVAVARVTAESEWRDQPDPRSWVRRLANGFPGDPTCLAPLLLHVVSLRPGEAIHLPAGNLHAYLEGAGVEIMAASDNVLRGGLTPKHVDVRELLTILRFQPGIPPGLEPEDLGAGVVGYDAGESSFALALIEPPGPRVIEPVGPSLLLATHGRVDVAGADHRMSIDHGDAAFVAPGEGRLTVSGPGRLWWATVGAGLPR